MVRNKSIVWAEGLKMKIGKETECWANKDLYK